MEPALSPSMKTTLSPAKFATITLNKSDTADFRAGEMWVFDHAKERAQKMADRLGACVIVETCDGIALLSVGDFN